MEHRIRIGEWLVDEHLGQIEGPDGCLQLRPGIMRLLTHLASHAGEVLSKEELLETLWAGIYVSDNTLMNAVSELRRVLGDDPRAPRFILTIPKRGYRLIAPVSVPQAAPMNTAVKLAVLPFIHLGDDSGGQGFAALVTEIMIASLAESDLVWVASRTSVSSYIECSVSLPQIASKLAVDQVLEGGVARLEKQWIITARLYDADERLLWTRTFEDQLSQDLPELHEEIQRVAEQILAYAHRAAAVPATSAGAHERAGTGSGLGEDHPMMQETSAAITADHARAGG